MVTSPAGREGLMDDAVEPSSLGKAGLGKSGNSYSIISKTDSRKKPRRNSHQRRTWASSSLSLQLY